MDGEPRITIKEIARLAGVSIGTVDRVVHGRPGVSAETLARIHAIIRTTAYRPDSFARHLSTNKRYHFRVLMPRRDQDSGYWELCRTGIERSASLLAAYRVVTAIDEFDRTVPGSCNGLLEGLRGASCDGLLVAPVLPQPFGGFFDAIDSPIPYGFFDCWIEGGSPRFAIVQDAHRGGMLAGRMLSLLAPGDAPFVIVNAYGEDAHIRRRIGGALAYLGRIGRIARVHECPDITDERSLDRFMTRLFGNGTGPAGILVANASGHHVARWLEAEGKKRGRALVSWDLVPDNLRALADGSMDCVISQRPGEQASRGLELLYRCAVLGEPVERLVDVPIDIYFRENIPRENTPAAEGKISPEEGRIDER